jgi:hypothetical protein
VLWDERARESSMTNSIYLLNSITRSTIYSLSRSYIGYIILLYKPPYLTVQALYRGVTRVELSTLSTQACITGGGLLKNGLVSGTTSIAQTLSPSLPREDCFAFLGLGFFLAIRSHTSSNPVISSISASAIPVLSARPAALGDL